MIKFHEIKEAAVKLVTSSGGWHADPVRYWYLDIHIAVPVPWTLFSREKEEKWCGCDGQGMAHKPGAKGFRCSPEVQDSTVECLACGHAKGEHDGQTGECWASKSAGTLESTCPCIAFVAPAPIVKCYCVDEHVCEGRGR